jgi:UDP-glucose 4-epimerase
MEVYCQMFTRLYGLETIGLRYFNVFGPRQSLENKYAVAVPKFITSLLAGRPPPIHGDGRQTRDFTHVANVVHANLRAAAARKGAGEVFNIASGQRHSVQELAELIRKILGSRVKPRFGPKRLGDVMHTWADIRKAKRQLGFKVLVPFDEGVKLTTLWFQRNRREWNLQ